jgi:endonuclease YncB( thermonuclease family)
MTRVTLLVGLLCAVPLCGIAGGWRELEVVTFDAEEYNDGDSFRARRNRSKYIFRLYFVDAPETDDRYPDRLDEQAAYFGVSVEQAIEIGKEAETWLREQLKDQTFTVFTQYKDAQGASDRKRYFAMVKLGDRWLSELLVENGFVRLYGFQEDLPDGTSRKQFSRHLARLEKQAKEQGKGIWRLAKESASPSVLRVSTAIFSSQPPHDVVGTLPAGWEVSVGEVTRPGFRSVRFISESGNTFTGEMMESQVPR